MKAIVKGKCGYIHQNGAEIEIEADNIQIIEEAKPAKQFRIGDVVISKEGRVVTKTDNDDNVSWIDLSRGGEYYHNEDIATDAPILFR